MTIIDNTEEYSPILTHVPKPTFKTKLQELKYWEEQQNRWINGYNGIPGTLYFKTQETKIINRVTGETIKPICRDSDLIVHEQILKNRKEEKVTVVIKGRGYGLSTDIGCLVNYSIRVQPGSTSIVTSSNKNKISSLFSEKIAFCYDNLDEAIQPVQINRNETASSAGLRCKISHLNRQGNQTTSISQVICRETSERKDSASAFSGQGAYLGCYDELFLHKRREELIRSSSSCFIDSLTKQTIGHLIVGGTVEDTLSNKELFELQQLINQVKSTGYIGTMKAELLFIPSWMGTELTNGHSNQLLATEKWQKKCDELDKLEDKSALRAFRMNNPMSLDDIFQVSNSSVFEQDVIDKIKEQRSIVISSKISPKKSKLIEINNSVTHSLNSTNNTFLTIEDPKPNVSYYIVIDGVATGNSTGNENGSSIASIVIKTFDPDDNPHSPVSLYHERPQTVEQGYINILNQAKFYNQFNNLKGIMTEANAGNADHFLTFLTKNNFQKYAMKRQDLSGKSITNTSKYFQYVTIDIRDYQIRQANIFLRKFTSSIKLLPLLNEMLAPPDENTDILDAFLMYFIANKDYDKKPIPKTLINKKLNQSFKIIKDKSGKTKIIRF